jgi:hypothetical protein
MLSSSGILVAQIIVSKNENNVSISIGNPDKKENITINYQKADLKNTFTASVSK